MRWRTDSLGNASVTIFWDFKDIKSVISVSSEILGSWELTQASQIS